MESGSQSEFRIFGLCTTRPLVLTHWTPYKMASFASPIYFAFQMLLLLLSLFIIYYYYLFIYYYYYLLLLFYYCLLLLLLFSFTHHPFSDIGSNWEQKFFNRVKRGAGAAHLRQMMPIEGVKVRVNALILT